MNAESSSAVDCELQGLRSVGWVDVLTVQKGGGYILNLDLWLVRDLPSSFLKLGLKVLGSLGAYKTAKKSRGDVYEGQRREFP